MGKRPWTNSGREFQVHPTTLRDVQEGIGDRLLTFMETEEGSPILRKVQLIRNTLGTAMKEDAANDALDLRPDTDPHRDWITRDGRVREWRGKLVRWGSNLSERAVFALDDMGRPAQKRVRR